jgi:hypothetical protein
MKGLRRVRLLGGSRGCWVWSEVSLESSGVLISIPGVDWLRDEMRWGLSVSPGVTGDGDSAVLARAKYSVLTLYLYSPLFQSVTTSLVQYGAPAQESIIKTVAICAGSGGSMFKDVKADLYWTGEMGHVSPDV